MAERFAARGHQVDALTTTARAPSEDWGTDYFPAGVTLEAGVDVHRFGVDRRDRDAFDRANAFFLSQPIGQRRPALPKLHVEAFLEQNINSHLLLQHLREHGGFYDALIFLPYLYGPTLTGLPLVRDRAWLQPCLHHESYAFVPQVAGVFHQARGLLFNSDGELELALHLYGPGIRHKSYVVGQWIDEPLPAQTGGRIGQFAPHRERYVLYLGRRDETKNVGLLIESFLSYRRQNYATMLKLVLAGVGTTSYHDETHGIVDLGVVSESQRDLLIDQCLALFQPSYNESFSRVVMEAWARERPVAVNAQCISTAQAVRSCEGGWLATTKNEWADVMRRVDAFDATQLAELGRRGNEYYRETATVEGVMERYETALQLKEPRAGPRGHVYHIVPSLDLTDDCVRRALTIDEWLRKHDCATTIDAQPRNRGPIPEGAILALHSPLAGDLERALAFGGDVVLFYDAARFEQATDALAELAPWLRLAYAGDEPTANFLRELGVRDVEILPFALTMRCWDVEPDPALLAELNDGRLNCLFAGAIREESCCEQLLSSFAFLLSFDVDARLIVVGALDRGNRYHADFAQMMEDYKLQERVRFLAPDDASALAAAFQAATLFWSMSESNHSQSNFLDAMSFDVPILAYATAQNAALLGEAGVLFKSKEDLVRIAALAKLLLREADLRSPVIAAQEARRAALVPDEMPEYQRLGWLLGRVRVEAG